MIQSKKVKGRMQKDYSSHDYIRAEEYDYNIRMQKRIILTLIVNLLLVISSYCLVLLISRSQETGDETSKIRFIYFLGVHLVAFIVMILSIKIQQAYDCVMILFVCLVLASAAFFICEEQVKRIYNSPKYIYSHYTGHLQKLQLTYLNIYFLVYMYSLIGAIPSGIFLIATELLMWKQERFINQHKDKCLSKVNYLPNMTNSDCSICLLDFQQNTKLIKINRCQHIFHQKCLCQWLRYNTICPLDRRNIFLHDRQQDNDE